jgi:hypothetical protein
VSHPPFAIAFHSCSRSVVAALHVLPPRAILLFHRFAPNIQVAYISLSKCTYQILHITHVPYFSIMLNGMPKNTIGDDCKTNRPCMTTTPYITFPCQTSSSNDLQANLLSSSYHHLQNFPPFVIFSTIILVIGYVSCPLPYTRMAPFQILPIQSLNYFLSLQYFYIIYSS